MLVMVGVYFSVECKALLKVASVKLPIVDCLGVLSSQCDNTASAQNFFSPLSQHNQSFLALQT